MIELLLCIQRSHSLGFSLIVDLFQSSKIVDIAPVFKFLYLIWEPTFLWIQATVSTNPTGATAMTFGQA